MLKRKLFSICASILLGLMLGKAPNAQTLGIVQTYYVPIAEDDISDTLNFVAGSFASDVADDNIQTVISITIGFGGTLIHYDHREDDYEPNIANPDPSGTTQVWGDGNAANGAPPGFPGDLLNAGDVVILRNEVPIPRIINPNVLSTFFFDGGDKIAADKPIVVTRVGWAEGPGTLLAGAVEVFSTTEWGTNFEAPIGENLATAVDNDMFEMVTVSYMASEDGTLLTIDLDGDGVADDISPLPNPIPLEEGDSFLIPLTAQLQVGGKATSNKPMQAHALTGNINTDYEMRWAVVVPVDDWSNEYFVPVGTVSSDPTAVFIYNPDPGPGNLAVSFETNVGVQPPVSVPPRGVARVDIPDGSGAAFNANGQFYAIATIDSSGVGKTYDWGISLLPSTLLSSQALVGFAPGVNPNGCLNPLPPFNCPNNGSPVWVTAVADTNINVDFDNDGSVDLGPIAVSRLDSVKIFDPDNDQTGMRVFSDDGALIAVAWGEDPSTAEPAGLFFDAGTVVPPLPEFTVAKDVSAVEAMPGDSLSYTIIVTNTSTRMLTAVQVSDILPLGVTYTPGTTNVDDGISITAIPDDAPTLFPLDDGGVLLGGLAPNQSFIITFDVTINADILAGNDPGEDCPDPQTALINNVTAVALGITKEDDALTCVEFEPNIGIEKSTNGVDADNPIAGDAPQIAPGDPVTWTYVVTNTGGLPLTNVTVVDDQGVAVSCPQTTLDPGESMNCTANGTAEDVSTTGFTTVPGKCGPITNTPLYQNMGTATGQSGAGQVDDVDPSHYCNPFDTDIDIEKSTNGVDADNPIAGDAPQIAPGDPVTWTYVVTNTGGLPLTNVTVVDDQGVAVSCPQTTLDPGESMNCTANGAAEDVSTTGFTTVPGKCGPITNTPLYQNMGTATGQSGAGQVDDVDPSHYCNPPPPPPGGGEGCTPGYWKQPHHFDSWDETPYEPGQLFSSVFENAFPGQTLLEVLSQGGGGLKALGRHTVAALLNASSSVDFDLSAVDVIDAFNAVFPGSKRQYNALKDEFADFNEQGCPLN